MWNNVGNQQHQHQQQVSKKILMSRNRIVILLCIFMICFSYGWQWYANKTVAENVELMRSTLEKVQKEIHVIMQTKDVKDLNKLNELVQKMETIQESIVVSKIKDLKEVYDLVQEDLERLQNQAHDKTGRADLAQESAGGFIASIGDTKLIRLGWIESFAILIGSGKRHNLPNEMIKPSMNPGECFAFQGSKGSVTIGLQTKAFLKAITVEHIPKHMAPLGSIENAPKHFSVTGLDSIKAKEGFDFGSFMFDIHKYEKDPFQIFKFKDSEGKSFKYVRIDFISNHGNPNNTCVYRIRLHGQMDHENQGH